MNAATQLKSYDLTQALLSGNLFLNGPKSLHNEGYPPSCLGVLLITKNIDMAHKWSVLKVFVVYSETQQLNTFTTFLVAHPFREWTLGKFIGAGAFSKVR